MSIISIVNRILRCNIIFFFEIAVLSIFLSAIEIIAPYLNGKFIDQLVCQEKTTNLLKMLAYILLIEMMYIVCIHIYSIVSERLQSKCIFEFRMILLEHLRRVPLLEIQKYNPIYLNERVNQDVTQLSSATIRNFANMFLKGILFLAYILIVFKLNREICYCLLCVLPIYVFAYKKYQKQLYEISLKIKDKANIYYQTFNEQFQMMETIKLDANFQNQNNYIEKEYGIYFWCLKKYTLLAANFKTVETLISLTIRMGILLFGIIYIHKEKMTVGNLVTITIYLNMLIDIVNYYISMAKTYQDLRASYNRVKMFLKIQEEENGNKEVKEILSIKAKITCINVKTMVTKKREFYGVKGKTYGIAGENGIGKTTFLKKLVGILPLEEGDFVKLNNIRLNKLDMLRIREKKIGFVSQKHMLTQKQVGEIFKEIVQNINSNNLAYYLTFREFDFPFELISRLWNKSYANISDGEKQIVSVLRILCKPADVLILDEPSSNLDELKKEWLVNLLKTIKKDKIIILISHDAMVLENCDEILCFD